MKKNYKEIRNYKNNTVLFEFEMDDEKKYEKMLIDEGKKNGFDMAFYYLEEYIKKTPIDKLNDKDFLTNTTYYTDKRKSDYNVENIFKFIKGLKARADKKDLDID